MIKTKRWDERREADDGFRLLICRYRPRALRKKDETWDLWWSQIGPSKELHAAFYGKHDQTPIGWEEYRQRYLDEMKGEEQRESIAVLAEQIAAGKTITLLCSSACTDAAHCHRTLLKELIEDEVSRLQHSARPRPPVTGIPRTGSVPGLVVPDDFKEPPEELKEYME